MDWYKIVKSYYDAGYYTPEQIVVFVQKGKITVEQYKEITGLDYTV